MDGAVDGAAAALGGETGAAATGETTLGAAPPRKGVTGSTGGAVTPGGSSRNVYSRTSRPCAQFNSTIRSRYGSLSGLCVVTVRYAPFAVRSMFTRPRESTP